MSWRDYKDMLQYPMDALLDGDPETPIILDTETAGHTSDSNFIIYYSWASEDSRIGAGAGPITTTAGFEFFKAILNSSRAKVCHNITADLDFVRCSGLADEWKGKRPYCTLLAHALIDEYHPTHALDHLVRKIFNRSRPDVEVLERYKKGIAPAKKNLFVPQEVMHVYALQDAVDTLDLWRWERQRLIDEGLWELYENTMDAEMGWYQMELDGIEFDTIAATESLEEINPIVELLEQNLYERFGEEFNILSPKQLSGVLKKHVPLTKRTPTGGLSTDIETLRKFTGDSRIQTLIAALKLKRAGSKIRKRIEEGSNRLFPEFGQTLVTGRSSCSGIPLQQIPKRASRISVDDVGSELLVGIVSRAYKGLRRMWIAAPGSTLVTFDYDQAEYRAAAHYSGSERLLSLLRDPTADFHSITAQLVFGEVTPVLRDITKFINFGLLYGMGVGGLEKLISHLVTEPSAMVLRRYEQNLPEMRAFQQAVLMKYKERGYVRDVFGRRYRQIPVWFKKLHETDDYAIINYLCQGTVANIKRYAIGRLWKLFKGLREQGRRSKLVVEIHDELGFEIYPEDAEIIYNIHALMTDFPMFNLPFTTAPNVGSNLLEVKEMTLDDAVQACKDGRFIRQAA